MDIDLHKNPLQTAKAAFISDNKGCLGIKSNYSDTTACSPHPEMGKKAQVPANLDCAGSEVSIKP